MVTIYHDKDADLKVLKDKTIAIVGWGNQGHAQGENLKDSGLDVIAADRTGLRGLEEGRGGWSEGHDRRRCGQEGGLHPDPPA